MTIVETLLRLGRALVVGRRAFRLPRTSIIKRGQSATAGDGQTSNARQGFHYSIHTKSA